jgi:hypothetical protein
LACACVLTAVIGAASLRADTGDESTPADSSQTSTPEMDPAVVHRIVQRQRQETWHWERVMGRPLTLELKNPPTDVLGRIAAWRRLAERTRLQAQNPPHKRAWLCIHHFEGAWNDPGPPYYGGLQMDLSFQRTYGWAIFVRKGTANNWTPLEQMWTAERARRSGRGFYPWPNTARFCGLI